MARTNLTRERAQILWELACRGRDEEEAERIDVPEEEDDFWENRGRKADLALKAFRQRYLSKEVKS